MYFLILFIISFHGIQCEYDPCCEFETHQFDSTDYYNFLMAKEKDPILINPFNNFTAFAQFQLSRLEEQYVVGMPNDRHYSVDGPTTLITNPMKCVYDWAWNSDNLTDDSVRQYVKFGNSSYYARLENHNGGYLHGLWPSRGRFNNSATFKIMYIDCKATAEKFIKQLEFEFEKPTIDFDKIQNSNKARTVTFFYTSSFENDSPQTYTENFEYTESKQVSVTLQSSKLDEAMISSSWMKSEMKEKHWDTSGSAGVSIPGLFSIGGGGGGGRRNMKADEKSGTSSRTTRTETSDARSMTSTLSVTKTGSITVEPFSRAKVVGAHYDIKNTSIENTIWIKLGVTEQQEYFTNERICALVERTRIAGNITITRDYRPGQCYLKIPITMRIDMGTDNVISIRGSPIFYDEVANGTSNEWYQAIVAASEEESKCTTISFKSTTSILLVIVCLVSIAMAFLSGLYIGKQKFVNNRIRHDVVELKTMLENHPASRHW